MIGRRHQATFQPAFISVQSAVRRSTSFSFDSALPDLIDFINPPRQPLDDHHPDFRHIDQLVDDVPPTLRQPLRFAFEKCHCCPEAALAFSRREKRHSCGFPSFHRNNSIATHNHIRFSQIAIVFGLAVCVVRPCQVLDSPIAYRCLRHRSLQPRRTVPSV